MIGMITQKMNGIEIMTYDRLIYTMPVIDSHINTPCIPANETGYDLGMRVLAGLEWSER